jgi:hypothetical protein
MSQGMREPFPGFPPPITTRPDGLLSLLGLQNSGKYPQHLAYDTLQCGVDLTRWYLESEQDFPTLTQLWGGAIGFTNFFTVPDGEAWVVLGGTYNYPAGLAAARTDVICRANSTAGAGSYVALSNTVATPIGSAQMIGVDPGNHGWLLRPLTQIGMYACVAAAAVNATLCMRVARLRRA